MQIGRMLFDFNSAIHFPIHILPFLNLSTLVLLIIIMCRILPEIRRKKHQPKYPFTLPSEFIPNLMSVFRFEMCFKFQPLEC